MTIQLTIAPDGSGAIAHIRGVHGWHTEAVARYPYVWELMRAAGIERVRIDHCLRDYTRLSEAIDMLLQHGLAPLLCLDGSDGLNEGGEYVEAALISLANAYGPQAASWPLEYARNPPEQYMLMRSYFSMCQATMIGIMAAEDATGLRWQIGGPSFNLGAYPGWASSYGAHLSRGTIRHDYTALHWYGQRLNDIPSVADELLLAAPVRMTEFNLDGSGTSPDLDTNAGAIWLFSTMASVATAIEWYLTGAYGQAIGGDADGRGRLGLVTVDGTRTKRPQYWATYMWNKLGEECHEVGGLPDGVGGIADEAGRLLVWNTGDGPDHFDFTIPLANFHDWYYLSMHGPISEFANTYVGEGGYWSLAQNEAALLVPHEPPLATNSQLQHTCNCE